MKFSASISIFPYFPAAVLRVSGPDAKTFLQGQFTNDLNAIAPGGAVYGLWLDRKGKVIGDGNVIQAAGAPEFWIASISSPAAVIGAHLGSHIIADDVALADETASWRGISFMGSGAGGWLGSGSRAGFVFPGRRASGENWEWIFPESDLASANLQVAGAPVARADDVERMRIASCIPSIPGDIGPADLPNEGGLDREAISYSKGCYLGQEVMARIKSLGRVRRTLVRVRGSVPPPELPAGLWVGDRREGELRSAVGDAGGFTGLALVSTATASRGDALALALGAAPVVEVVPAP
jgi:folate-binding protein YgfZ